MTIKQDTKLVGAVDKLVFTEHMLDRLGVAAIAEELMQGQNGVVAGVVGVMAGGPVGHIAIIVADGEIVRNRNRLIVGDEKSILRSEPRAPGAHPRIGTGLIEIDRRLAPLFLLFRVFRHPVFMRSPAEFGGLETFGDKTFHGPCVPESPEGLRLFRPLGIALGHMHALDAKLLHQLCPAFPVM
ncbi:hypothetical protein D3C86_1139510 [compost metagenome]